jgi:hypothetical protein
VLKMMWLSRLKLIAVILLLTMTAGLGAGVLAFPAFAREQADNKKQVAADEKPAAETKKQPREALRYPDATLKVTGNGGVSNIGSQYVSNDLALAGNGNVNIVYKGPKVARVRILTLVE